MGWIELLKTEQNFKVLKDLIVKEQLINSCSKELSVHYCERAPETLEEIAKIAHGKYVVLCVATSQRTRLRRKKIGSLLVAVHSFTATSVMAEDMG